MDKVIMSLTRTVMASLLFLACALAGYGAGAVGRVISDEPFEIDGITAPARSFVPVSSGEDVMTKGASALIQFIDGATVVLQPNSEIKIVGEAGRVQIRIIRGSAQYKLKSTR